MRSSALASIALALMSGCLRFGYGSNPGVLDGGFDSGLAGRDGSVFDSAAADSSSARDDAATDAAIRGDAAAEDASALVGDSGSNDAGAALDASLADAGAADASLGDAGLGDSGAADSGLADAGPADSGAMDSGATDPGTTDPVDPVWTEDCPGLPHVLFCDDFEDSFVKWDYAVHTRGTTAVTTDYKRGGSYSMRASTSSSTTNVQSQARRSVKALGHRKSGHLWARYYYYLPSSVSVTQKFSTGVISEYEDPYFGFSVLIFPDGVGLESGDFSRRITSTIFPRNQWVCVEMHVHLDPGDGTFEFFLDGISMTSLTNLNTVPNQGYTTFEVGIHYANFLQGAITTYADDVMVGTSRLGCN